MFARLKKELINVFPAIVYFFLAFNLFNLTFGTLMLKEAGIPLASFGYTVISALIVGKVMIVVDNVPFFNIFVNRPLIYNTVWKTVLYTFFSFLARRLERFIALHRELHDAKAAWSHTLHDVSWERFWTVQIWALILFFIFVVWREILRGVGKERLYGIFFEPRGLGTKTET